MYEINAWKHFLDLVSAHGGTSEQVNKMFSDQDKADLLEEPQSKLPLHAKTISDAIKRTQAWSPLEL